MRVSLIIYITKPDEQTKENEHHMRRTNTLVDVDSTVQRCEDKDQSLVHSLTTLVQKSIISSSSMTTFSKASLFWFRSSLQRTRSAKARAPSTRGKTETGTDVATNVRKKETIFLTGIRRDGMTSPS